jgi:hypothetical protein
MKKLTKLVTVSILILSCWQLVTAQSSRSQKKAAKEAEVKKMVEDNNYTFVANFAIPQEGGTRQLTSTYDLRITKDSVIAFLPYYGRAYLAPINPTRGGIEFTSTNFSYDKGQRKNGNWDILIKPKDNNITDWRDVEQLRLNISPDGYASLSIISSNRDPISFWGDIVAKSN